MIDEYEDDGSVVPPPPATSGRVVGDGSVRTIDRRIGGLAVIGCIGAACIYFSVMKSSHDSMATPAIAATTPVLGDSTRLKLPSAPMQTPTPPSIRQPPQSPQPTPSPLTPAPSFAAGNGNGADASQPHSPSPEEAWLIEERRRVLDTRRSSSRVDLSGPGEHGALATQQDGPDRGQHAPLGEQDAGSSNASQQGQLAAMNGGATRYLPTRSPYEIRRGTLINAAWAVNYDSTISGAVLKVVVTKTVLDSVTHLVPVIPAGTIITGSDQAQSHVGEARGEKYFDQMELPAPDSRKYYMGINPGAGRMGENGVDVSVDTHAGRDFGHAALYSLLQAGVNLASRASTVVDIGTGTSQVFQQQQHSAPTFHAYVGDSLVIVAAYDIPLDRFKENP